MTQFILLAISFLIAFAFAWIELATSKYPRTIGPFWRWSQSRSLWIYSAIYGGISLAFASAYASGIVKVSGPLLNSTDSSLSLMAAIGIGVSAKALLHIRVFSLSAAGGQDSFPIGTETLVQLFEPWLLKSILIDEFNAVNDALRDRAAVYEDIATVKAQMIADMPSLPDPERAALQLDINNAPTVKRAMEIYLRAFSVKALTKLFP